MAGCQDSSQLRVTYITNDCGLTERERGGGKGRRGTESRTKKRGARSRASTDASRSVGGPMLRASHRLSNRRYADPVARLPYFNASVIGSPPATGILKGASARGAICSALLDPASNRQVPCVQGSRNRRQLECNSPEYHIGAVD